MSRIKYINLEDTGIVIFGNHIQHSSMAGMFSHEKVIGAGFVTFGDEPEVYGESVSLNIASTPNCQVRLNRMVKGH